jgi:hypothetical protein
MRKEYLVKNRYGEWMRQTETQCRRRLKACGFGASKSEGKKLSPLDYELLRIIDNEAISFSGPIAGLKEGFYGDSLRILVTESPNLIIPKEGNWKTMKALIDAILDDEKYHQQTYLYGWLRVAIESLNSGRHSFGQAMVFAGKAGCGKSFLQNLITALLGGRSAKPYQYMTGKTTFNADLFGAEHLMIEDEAPDSSFKARKIFGIELKQITVNRTQRLHAKGRDAISLKPLWRISISLNDEPEDLHVLPPMDQSMEDKLILLHAYKRQFPMPTNTIEQREAFEKQLLSEMPAFVHWLLHDFTIPDDLKSERFGITHFHHPKLLAAIEALSPEIQMLDMVDAHLRNLLPDEFTSLDLEKLLRERVDRYLIDRVFTFGRACGTFLGKLARSHPDRVVDRRTSLARKWLINPSLDNPNITKS